MKNKIIHRGTLTIDKLKDLCFQYLEIKSDSDIWNPHINANVITLVRQPEGHYKGYIQKGGVVVESRELIPEHALQALLTHK